MRTKLFAGVAFAALMIPASALAQSTGTIDFEEGSEEIVVTGSRAQNGVNGIVVPDTTKTRGVLNQEFIQRQAPGQSVNDLINQLPGVSYTNNDPFGSSGGSLNIRGFESSRISQTFDGIPLNDTGNYAIYGNQQLDPELIEQVNVNMGTTDVDSPTAGATGSTVNYRTRNPGEEFGVKLIGSAGDFDFFRTEITFVNWVRDRTAADLHVLASDEDTGGGGDRYTMTFTGLRTLVGSEVWLVFATSSNDSPLPAQREQDHERDTRHCHPGAEGTVAQLRRGRQ